MADRSLYSDTSSPMPTGLEFLDQYGDRGTQLFNAAIWPLSSVGGTANAVAASCDPPLLAGLVEHMKFLITWAADNTGGMTLAIDGGTPVPILTASGSAMQAGDALTGVRVILEYVGGAFRVIGGASSGSAAGPYVTTITASGTWVKPTGYADDALVILEAWGGGKGGGRESNNSSGGAAAPGGIGGRYRRREMRYADVPSSLSVTIGAGGAGATSAGSAGANGGNTTIGSLLTAPGGGVNSISGGPLWDGGSSGAGDAVHGGAGGGPGAATGNPAGGSSLFAGNGGAGGGQSGGAATAGTAPGGGGGGAGAGLGVNSNNGAAGARGEVRIRIVV